VRELKLELLYLMEKRGKYLAEKKDSIRAERGRISQRRDEEFTSSSETHR